MIMFSKLVSEIVLTATTPMVVVALITKRFADSIRWNLQAIAMLLFALALCGLCGCAPVHYLKHDPDAKIIDCYPDPNYPDQPKRCRPPTEQEAQAREDYKVAYLADPSNYGTVWNPFACDLLDIASTGIGYATGKFHEARAPLKLSLGPSIVAGFAFDWWAYDEAKKGNTLPARIACAAHIVATVRGVALIVGGL